MSAEGKILDDLLEKLARELPALAQEARMATRLIREADREGIAYEAVAALNASLAQAEYEAIALARWAKEAPHG